MQVGPFLKILKNKGGIFSGMSYSGGHFLKTNLLATNFHTYLILYVELT